MVISNSQTLASTDMLCLRVLISGRVQGVGYRYFTQKQALELGLGGWVRNLADGRVEAMVEGKRLQVEAIVQWCHTGPIAAKVDEIEIEEQPLQRFEQFSIRR